MSPSLWLCSPPRQHTKHQAVEITLLDPKSPGRNNHCSGPCTAASSQTDAFAVSQGKADTEYNASDEAFPEWGRQFCIVFAITSLATTWL